MVDVAITIVNYKSREDTLRCLDSLISDLAGASFSYRIIVVDNGSSILRDDITERYPQIKYSSVAENKGFGGGQNYAFTQEEARYYFLVNPDLVFDKTHGATLALFNWMEKHPRVGMAGPQLLNYDGSLQLSCYSFPRLFAQIVRRLSLHKRYNKLDGQVQELLMANFDHARTAPVDWLMGSALMIRASALQQVCGFDERFFMYFEDCDLCRRFWIAGWPVYYVSDIQITHGHRRESASVPGIKALFKNKLTRIHVKSWLKYFYKWRGKQR